MKTVMSIVTGLIVFAAVVLGGWQAGWWFRTQDVNREAVVNRESYGFQQSRMDELGNLITDLNKITVQITEIPDPTQNAALRAQRLAEADQACRVARDITFPPSDQAQWRDGNCTAGTVSPSSPYSN